MDTTGQVNLFLSLTGIDSIRQTFCVYCTIKFNNLITGDKR